MLKLVSIILLFKISLYKKVISDTNIFLSWLHAYIFFHNIVTLIFIFVQLNKVSSFQSNAQTPFIEIVDIWRQMILLIIDTDVFISMSLWLMLRDSLLEFSERNWKCYEWSFELERVVLLYLKWCNYHL